MNDKCPSCGETMVKQVYSFYYKNGDSASVLECPVCYYYTLVERIKDE